MSDRAALDRAIAPGSSAKENSMTPVERRALFASTMSFALMGLYWLIN